MFYSSLSFLGVLLTIGVGNSSSSNGLSAAVSLRILLLFLVVSNELELPDGESLLELPSSDVVLSVLPTQYNCVGVLSTAIYNWSKTSCRF